MDSQPVDSMEDVRRVAAVLWTMGTLLLVCINVLAFIKRVMDRYATEESKPEEATAKPARPCGCED